MMFSDMNILFRKESKKRACGRAQLVDWLVVWGLTALLDSISVYIGLSPREGERKEKL